MHIRSSLFPAWAFALALLIVATPFARALTAEASPSDCEPCEGNNVCPDHWKGGMPAGSMHPLPKLQRLPTPSGNGSWLEVFSWLQDLPTINVRFWFDYHRQVRDDTKAVLIAIRYPKDKLVPVDGTGTKRKMLQKTVKRADPPLPGQSKESKSDTNALPQGTSQGQENVMPAKQDEPDEADVYTDFEYYISRSSLACVVQSPMPSVPREKDGRPVNFYAADVHFAEINVPPPVIL